MIPHAGYFERSRYFNPNAAENQPQTVYILANDAGETIYVGITQRWENRRTQHKRKPWWSQVARIDLVEVPDRYTARAMEWALIRCRKPLFNKQGVIRPDP